MYILVLFDFLERFFPLGLWPRNLSPRVVLLLSPRGLSPRVLGSKEPAGPVPSGPGVSRAHGTCPLGSSGRLPSGRPSTLTIKAEMAVPEA